METSPNLVMTFIDLFVTIFSLLLIARVILSYVMQPGNGVYDFVASVTEPVLAPVRRLLPQTIGLDLAPLVTFILLRIVQSIAHSYFG